MPEVAGCCAVVRDIMVRVYGDQPLIRRMVRIRPIVHGPGKQKHLPFLLFKIIALLGGRLFYCLSRISRDCVDASVHFHRRSRRALPDFDPIRPDLPLQKTIRFQDGTGCFPVCRSFMGMAVSAI